MESQRGITLVALVVSIVIMVILVGVTISVTINDGGIFSQAKEAANRTENRIDYETNELPTQMQDFVNESLQNLFGK